MAKERKGYCFSDKEGRWFARMTFTDDHGRRRNIKRRALDEKDANKILKGLLREIEDKGEKGPSRPCPGSRFSRVSAQIEAIE